MHSHSWHTGHSSVSQPVMATEKSITINITNNFFIFNKNLNCLIIRKLVFGKAIFQSFLLNKNNDLRLFQYKAVCIRIRPRKIYPLTS
jgi:hypothetical protein